MLKGVGVGRLTKDATVFSYRDKTGVNFTLACNRGFGGDDDQVSFLKCTMFNRDENLARHLHQGDQLTVHGDIVIKPYDPNDQYSGEASMIVDTLEFGARKM
jgi:single-stranded DNA-binding protein